MKKFITFCVAVFFGTMLLNSPALSEASKVPPEMGVDERQDKELMDEQKKNEGSGTKQDNAPPGNPPIIQKWPGFFDCGPSEVIMGIVNGKYKELDKEEYNAKTQNFYTGQKYNLRKRKMTVVCKKE